MISLTTFPDAVSPMSVRAARWGVIAFFFVTGVIVSTWAVRVPDVKQQIDATPGAFGMALLGIPVGAIIAMTQTGRLVSRFGSRAGLVVSAAFVCLTPVLPGLARSPMELFAGLLVFGLFFGTMRVAMNAQAVRVESAYGRPIMSSFHGVFSATTIVGALFGAAIASRGVAVALQFFSTGLAMAVIVLLSSRWLLPPGKGETAEEGSRFAWPTGPLAGLSVIAFCTLLAEGSVASWSGIFLKENLGATVRVSALAYTSFSILMSVGRFAGDWLARTLGPKLLVRCGGLLVFIGLGGAMLVPSIPSVIVGYGLAGLGLSTIFPITMSAAGRTPGISASAALAAVATAGAGGMIVGPPMIGQVSEATSLRYGIVLVAFMGLLIAAFANKVENWRFTEASTKVPEEFAEA
ncbi:MAG: MFS transporter [Chloroflexota bacterium]